MPETVPEIHMSQQPDRMVLLVDPDQETDSLAEDAIYLARLRMPKITGHMANSLQPIFGEGFFGIYFPDRKTWFLEQGIKPFTMKKLHGAIPMWIDDPTGAERRANPKAKTRRTEDGRTQVLIFRFASKKGARKTEMRRGKDGLLKPTSVPASYPGAPGRIAKREANRPLTRAGRVAGQVARGNTGVRWRHPGIVARQFLNSAIADTALDNGIELVPIYLCDNTTFFSLIRSL